MSSLSSLSKTVVGSTVNDIIGRYDMGNKKTLVATLRLLDKMSNGTINNPIAEVSMARKRGEDVSKILTPGDMYRKQFGECFTPKQLIRDMLDKLPADVWKHKDYKWLDNSVGGGNFLVEVLARLMVSLADQIPNEAARKKHIIEKMLYFVDLQAKNVFFTMQRLGNENDYDFNYHVGDSLEFDYWGGIKFDVVVGNPPYKKGIDLKFLDLFITKLDAKHVLIVHPSTYLIDLKGNSRYIKIKKLLEGKLKSATLFNGNKTFDVGLYVPCVIISYDRDYNGKCSVEYFDQKFDADVWNITKFGADWETIVKPFVEKMKKDCSGGNDVWSYSLGKTDKADKNKQHCQFAAIRGNVNMSANSVSNTIVKDDFYTMNTQDESCKGIRILDLTRAGNPIPTFQFPNENERDNFHEYCKTFFARFCLSLYKNNCDLSLGNMSLIPWLDFTQSWDDEKLFKHFGIDQKTQDYIYKFLPDYYGIRG